MGGEKAQRFGVSIALASIAIACATGPALRDGRYAARDGRWSIAAPPRDWKRVDAEGAVLAFARADRASMALAERCEGVARPVASLARELRSGVGASEVAEERTVVVAARDAVLQSLVVRGGRVRALTRAAPPCVQDLVLATAVDDAGATRDFDAWWASFEARP